MAPPSTLVHFKDAPDAKPAQRQYSEAKANEDESATTKITAIVTTNQNKTSSAQPKNHCQKSQANLNTNHDAATAF